MDESTDVSQYSQLMAFVRQVMEENFKEECLVLSLSKSLFGAEYVSEAVSNFFEGNGVDWVNILVYVITDSAPAILMFTVSFIEESASKTLPDHMNTILKWLVKTVNYIKSAAINTRLFRKIPEDMVSDCEVLLFYTSLRWSAAGNVFNINFRLKEELIQFLQFKGKQGLKIYLQNRNWELHTLSAFSRF